MALNAIAGGHIINSFSLQYINFAFIYLIFCFRPIVFNSEVENLSRSCKCELAGYQIPTSSPTPRLVRVGLVQNQVVLPTDAPIKDQVKVCSILINFS